MSVRNSIRDAIRSAIGLVEEVFNPQTLFLSGKQGAWYDPSDLSTLFQDAAGTIPVTGTGQPVGLMLDKRLGLVRGPDSRDTGAPSAFGTPPSAATYNADGEGTASRTDGSNFSYVTFTGVTIGKSYEITVRNRGGSNLSVRTSSIGTVLFTVPAGATLTGRVVPAGLGALSVAPDTNGSSISFTVLSVRELPGNHARQATAASRPIFRDVGGVRYLECDGVDDGMVTGSINFTGTDKMLVCAGVRKLSDAATGALLELSSSSGANSGTFALFSPTGALPTYGIRVRGTAEATPSISGIPSPDSSVVSLLGYIADDVSVIRRNGVVGASSSNDLGTGNYGNHPLYLFRRGGASLAFNGLFYGAIIAGSTYSASQIASAERYLAGKSGVTL